MVLLNALSEESPHTLKPNIGPWSPVTIHNDSSSIIRKHRQILASHTGVSFTILPTLLPLGALHKPRPGHTHSHMTNHTPLSGQRRAKHVHPPLSSFNFSFIVYHSVCQPWLIVGLFSLARQTHGVLSSLRTASWCSGLNTAMRKERLDLLTYIPGHTEMYTVVRKTV